MMTVYEQCLIFKSWGQNDPNYYRVFVGLGLTADQYKAITGDDYQATAAASTTPTDTSGTANVAPTA